MAEATSYVVSGSGVLSLSGLGDTTHFRCGETANVRLAREDTPCGGDSVDGGACYVYRVLPLLLVLVDVLLYLYMSVLISSVRRSIRL